MKKKTRQLDEVYWLVLRSVIFQLNRLFCSLEERKEISFCLWLQRPDCWRWFLVWRLLLAGYRRYKAARNFSFITDCSLPCISSKFSSSFLRLLAFFCMLCWIQFEIQKSVFNFSQTNMKHCMQDAKPSSFPSENDVIDLWWISYNKPCIVPTLFFQQTTAFELFLYIIVRTFTSDFLF